MKFFFVLCVVVVFASLLLHGAEAQPEPPCCKTCNVVQGYHKFYATGYSYSIESNPFLSRCGETCITDDIYPIVKIYAPNLENATDNTPCADLNYTVYNETVTYGNPGILSFQFDLYCRNQYCS